MLKKPVTLILFLVAIKGQKNVSDISMRDTLKPYFGKYYLLPVTDENGEIIPYVELRPVLVLAPFNFKTDDEWLLYERIKRRFLKVYPYAERAVQMYYYHTRIIDSLGSKRAVRKYIKAVKDTFMTTYFEEVKKLTVPEGEVLIKLINYMTGTTIYDIIKKYRGGVSATFWQTIASFWEHDLRATIDTTKLEDRYLLYFLRLKRDGLI